MNQWGLTVVMLFCCFPRTLWVTDMESKMTENLDSVEGASERASENILPISSGSVLFIGA